MAEAAGLNVAAELAELRGEMAEGFARLEGKFDLVSQALNRTTQDVNTLERETKSSLEAMDRRVSALESRRWPLASVAAVSGAVSAAVAAAAFLVGK